MVQATKHAVPSDRIEELAKPIKISNDFSVDRPLVQRVAKSATQVLCSDRVLELAKPNPKKCRNQPIIKKVTKGKTSVGSHRLNEPSTVTLAMGTLRRESTASTDV